ncbi:MAG: apolipoprotein N-acyltransferase [Treponema sp.]|nr:apolipoprotein N-acyltransferase [Treponema sp.]
MKSLRANAAAILAASVLFAAAFPNPLAAEGIAPLAWIAWVPVFWVIRRAGPGPAALWGALYGYLSYRLFVYWLDAFHPLAGLAAAFFQMIYLGALFFLLKAAVLLYPRRGYILQWLLWVSYEFLKTLGFLGFPYGIAGYTQWRFVPLIGIASVFGVWGVSALVLFPSVYLAQALPGKQPLGPAGTAGFFRRERTAALVWAAALAAALVYGLAGADYRAETAGTVRIALVQQNADPWKEEPDRRALRTLTALSRRALETEPETDLVVWPETAFVPRIYWHLTYRDDAGAYPLVRELIDFLAGEEAPFLIGNDDARLEVSGGRWDRVDYNGALLFERGELAGAYRKIRLVPFAEYFPYEKTFPRFYRALLEAGSRFWKPGTEPAVFTVPFRGARGDSGGVFRFSAPICFEDSFGGLSRDFTRAGAELIVNITNDAWAGSLAAQNQHLAMAVFRAVENRRSLVRAASSGQTCAVDPAGRITALAPAFTETFLNVSVPLIKRLTPYTLWGDLWGILFTVSAGMVLLFGAIRAILGTIKTGRGL